MLISIIISRNSAFLGSDKLIMLFFLLINVKMPTIVGILTFMSKKNFILRCVENEKIFMTSVPGLKSVKSDGKIALLLSKWYKFAKCFIVRSLRKTVSSNKNVNDRDWLPLNN